ncbi:fimbrial protein [Morganella psychrotolerans]|uniref:fimbrial protein n=1 Tax=Morganella psychrotolerans TaxID=368603 RepID=UPI0039B0E5DD
MTRNMTLLLSAGFMLLVSQFSAAEMTVSFEGNLVNPGCHLSDDSTRKEVVLPEQRFSELEYQGRSEPYFFQLEILDCSKNILNKTVKMTFSSNTTEKHNGIYYLKTAGSTNLLLALTDHQGKEIALNSAIDTQKITETGKGSINIVSLGVYAQKPFNTSLYAGDFSAMLTFNLDYQ